MESNEPIRVLVWDENPPHAPKEIYPNGIKGAIAEGLSESLGDAVAGDDGVEIARGLVNYAASEARQIMRKPSSEIEAILGYVDEPELIHRDNLVLA